MQKHVWIGALCGLWILSGISLARGAVTVKRINYQGWEGAYQLSNKTVELVFVSQIGRIMR